MFNGLIEAWRRWRRAISTKRELFALNEAQLRDIGIARTDIDRISRRVLPEYWTWVGRPRRRRLRRAPAPATG